MNTLVIGSGGREAAIVKALAKSKHSEKIFILNGNDGVSEAACVTDIDSQDHQKIGEFARDNKIDWVFIGPEAPLSEGLTDTLEDDFGLKVFGPRKYEAQMESSKAFTKALMEKYDIPTATHKTLTSVADSKAYLETAPLPIVLKKDGLAAGKGVIIAHTLEEALDGVDALQTEGEELVIEEFLDGDEFSLMVFVNGDTFIPFNIIAQDHKRAYDGDKGPNTGGMGVYAPVDYIDQKYVDEAIEKIVKPTVDAMVSEGMNYFGVLYLGAIVTKDGVKTIEYNARLGDPEAQVLLDLMESDLLEVLMDLDERKETTLSFRDEYVVGVMLASKNYPGTPELGNEVIIPADIQDDCIISALKRTGDNTFVTSGGRTVLVLGRGKSIEEAKTDAYNKVSQIEFENDAVFYRKDIGHRAF